MDVPGGAGQGPFGTFRALPTCPSEQVECGLCLYFDCTLRDSSYPKEHRKTELCLSACDKCLPSLGWLQEEGLTFMRYFLLWFSQSSF